MGDKKPSSVLTDDWESDLAAIIEKTNQNLNLLRKIGEKRDEPRQASSLLPRTRSGHSVVTKFDSERSADASINKWKKVLDDSTTMKRHIATKILDSHKSKKETSRAWEGVTTNQGDPKEPPKQSTSSFQPLLPLDEIKKSVEVKITSHAKATEKLVADLRLDLQQLVTDCALTAKKSDEAHTKIQATLNRFDVLESEANKLVETMPRVEMNTGALLKWRGSVESDIREMSSKIDASAAIQDKYVVLERQFGQLDNKLQKIHGIEAHLDALTKRIQTLETTTARNAESITIAHTVDITVAKAIQDFEERQVKRIDAVTELHESKLKSFLKTIQNQREHHERAVQFALESGFGDVHSEIEALQKRLDTRVDESWDSMEPRVTNLSKRITALEATSIEKKPGSQDEEQLLKLRKLIESYVPRGELGALVLNEINAHPIAAACRRLESTFVKIQQDADRKHHDLNGLAQNTSEDVARLRSDVAALHLGLQKTGYLETQMLRSKLIQCSAELEKLRQVRQEMNMQFERLEKDRDTQVARLTNHVRETEAKREKEVAALTAALQEKAVEIALSTGKLQSLQDVWKRDSAVLQSTKERMHEARQQASEMRAKLQRCHHDMTRQRIEATHLQESHHMLTQEWMSAKHEAKLAREALNRALVEKKQSTIAFLDDSIARLRGISSTDKISQKIPSHNAESLICEISSLHSHLDTVRDEMKRVEAAKLALEAELRASFQIQLDLKEASHASVLRARQASLDEALRKLKDCERNENEVMDEIYRLSKIFKTNNFVSNNMSATTALRALNEVVSEWQAGQEDCEVLNRLRASLESCHLEIESQHKKWEIKTQEHHQELQVILDEKAKVEKNLEELRASSQAENAKQLVLETSWAEANAKICELQETIKTLDSKYRDIMSQQSVLEGKVVELDDLKLNFGVLEQKNQDLVQLVQSLEENLAENEINRQDLIENARGLEFKLNEMQSAHETLSTEYDSIVIELEECHAALEVANSSKDEISLKLREANAQLKEYEIKFRTMHQSLDVLASAKSDAEQQLAQALTQVEIIEEEKNMLLQSRLNEEKLASLEADKRGFEKQMQEWAEREKQLIQDRDEWKNAVEIRRAALECEMGAVVAQLDAEREKTATREADLQEIISSLQIHVQVDNKTDSNDLSPLLRLKHGLEVLLATLKQHKADLDKIVQLISEHGEDTQHFADVQRAVNQLKLILADKSAVEDQAADHVQEILRCEEKYNALQVEFETQEATLFALREAFAAVEKQSQASIDNLEATKASWQAEAASHEAQITQLKEKVETSELLVQKAKFRLEQTFQRSSQELENTRENFIHRIEDDLFRLDEQVHSFSEDILGQQKVHDSTLDKISREQSVAQELNNAVAKLQEQLTIAPFVLQTVNRLHLAIQEQPAEKLSEVSNIKALENQLVAETEITARELLLKGGDISYVSKSLERLPEIQKRLNGIATYIQSLKVSHSHLTNSSQGGPSTKPENLALDVILEEDASLSCGDTVESTQPISTGPRNCRIPDTHVCDISDRNISTEDNSNGIIPTENAMSPLSSSFELLTEKNELNSLTMRTLASVLTVDHAPPTLDFYSINFVESEEKYHEIQTNYDEEIELSQTDEGRIIYSLPSDIESNDVMLDEENVVGSSGSLDPDFKEDFPSTAEMSDQHNAHEKFIYEESPKFTASSRDVQSATQETEQRTKFIESVESTKSHRNILSMETSTNSDSDCDSRHSRPDQSQNLGSQCNYGLLKTDTEDNIILQHSDDSHAENCNEVVAGEIHSSANVTKEESYRDSVSKKSPKTQEAELTLHEVSSSQIYVNYTPNDPGSESPEKIIGTKEVYEKEMTDEGSERPRTNEELLNQLQKQTEDSECDEVERLMLEKMQQGSLQTMNKQNGNSRENSMNCDSEYIEPDDEVKSEDYSHSLDESQDIALDASSDSIVDTTTNLGFSSLSAFATTFEGAPSPERSDETNSNVSPSRQTTFYESQRLAHLQTQRQNEKENFKTTENDEELHDIATQQALRENSIVLENDSCDDDIHEKSTALNTTLENRKSESDDIPVTEPGINEVTVETSDTETSISGQEGQGCRKILFSREPSAENLGDYLSMTRATQNSSMDATNDSSDAEEFQDVEPCRSGSSEYIEKFLGGQEMRAQESTIVSQHMGVSERTLENQVVGADEPLSNDESECSFEASRDGLDESGHNSDHSDKSIGVEHGGDTTNETLELSTYVPQTLESRHGLDLSGSSLLQEPTTEAIQQITPQSRETGGYLSQDEQCLVDQESPSALLTEMDNSFDNLDDELSATSSEMVKTNDIQEESDARDNVSSPSSIVPHLDEETPAPKLPYETSESPDDSTRGNLAISEPLKTQPERPLQLYSYDKQEIEESLDEFERLMVSRLYTLQETSASLAENELEDTSDEEDSKNKFIADNDKSDSENKAFSEQENMDECLDASKESLLEQVMNIEDIRYASESSSAQSANGSPTNRRSLDSILENVEIESNEPYMERIGLSSFTPSDQSTKEISLGHTTGPKDIDMSSVQLVNNLKPTSHTTDKEGGMNYDIQCEQNVPHEKCVLGEMSIAQAHSRNHDGKPQHSQDFAVATSSDTPLQSVEHE
ncbi:hypothetical protein AC1031_013217 [Aphanomyces cochlioides]|nr:hypothetical protein AC1031_013217 [Aphanomyces cochlioides]